MMNYKIMTVIVTGCGSYDPGTSAIQALRVPAIYVRT
jgi:hypothetical protein